MGLFDTIRSALSGSDDDTTADADQDETTEKSETEQPATTETEAESAETTEETPASEVEPADESTTDEAATDSADTGGFEWVDGSETTTIEGAAGGSSGEGETAADESSGDETGDLSPDDESGFDHLTTQDISDGPDMAEEAAEFITEAEGDDEADEQADDIEAISEDDPRAGFVEQADDLVAFWGEYDLDYSLDSLTNLDDMVEEQWGPERFEDAEFGGEDYDSQVFTDTVTQLGSYFGEVLVREHDGAWQQETGIGWTVSVPSGLESEATGATVTVFQVAEDCLTGASTFTGMHDALADRLNLSGRAGDGDTPVDLDRADIQTVASDEEIDDAAERLQAGAEDLADRWPDYDLDFTVESLERLESLLDEEVDRDRFEGVELGDETDQESMLLTAHVVGVAGYLAEVLRRQRDAKWAEDGRMVLVVERGDSRTRIDPIEVAIASVRGNGTLRTAVPDL